MALSPHRLCCFVPVHMETGLLKRGRGALGKLSWKPFRWGTSLALSPVLAVAVRTSSILVYFFVLHAMTLVITQQHGSAAQGLGSSGVQTSTCFVPAAPLCFVMGVRAGLLSLHSSASPQTSSINSASSSQ